MDKSLPELGTIGVYTEYLLEDNYQPKTVVNLAKPVRLKIEFIKVEQRDIFRKKDSLGLTKGLDSSLVSIEILDKFSMLQQINADKELLKYLEKSDGYKLVSEVILNFPTSTLKTILNSEEAYLVQNKQKTLSIELRNKNKLITTVEFNDGKIIDFSTSEFCWGLNKRKVIEIFDLVPNGSNCSSGLFKSAKKVKKKNEFNF